jgi:hypothetical protein
MAEINMSLDPMDVFHHGFQTMNKALARVSMNDRIYHVNYNTSKHKEGSLSQINGVDPKGK